MDFGNEGNLILLVVDSDEDAVSFMAALKASRLRNSLYLVNGGADAIRYLSARKPFGDREKFPLPAVLMLDLALLRKKAWRVLKWVRARAHLDGILVVVLSGPTPSPDLNRAYQMGANSFLAKPCVAQELLRLATVFPQYLHESVN